MRANASSRLLDEITDLSESLIVDFNRSQIGPFRSPNADLEPLKHGRWEIGLQQHSAQQIPRRSVGIFAEELASWPY